MVGVIGNSWALFLGLFFLLLGNGLQGSLLGVRGSIEGFSTELMGYVMAGYFIGFLGGSQATPWLLRRVGHVRVFAALASLVSAAFIVYASLVDPIVWFAMRVLVGFCFSGIYVVAESWINDASSNENRGKALSAYLLVQMFGVVVGQLLLNAADPAGYDLFVLISVLVSISFAPILLSVSPAPVYQTSKPMSLRELFATSPLGVVGSLLLGGVFGAMFGMSAIYASEIGLTVFETSIFVAVMYSGGVLSQYPIGWLSDRVDRRWMIISTSAIGAASCFLGYFAGAITLFAIEGFEVRVIYLSALFLGSVANPIYGLLAAHTNDFLEREQMSAASGGLVFINGLGATLGPVITGVVMEPSRAGPAGWWLFCFVLLAATAVYGLYRATQRPTVPADETAPYTPFAPRVTPVAVEILQEVALERQDELAAAEEAAEEENAEAAKRETTSAL